jgi:hypothetical protein
MPGSSGRPSRQVVSDGECFAPVGSHPTQLEASSMVPLDTRVRQSSAVDNYPISNEHCWEATECLSDFKR